MVEPFTPVRRQFQLIREMGIDYVDLTDSHDGASLGSEAGFVASLSLARATRPKFALWSRNSA